MLLKDKTAFVTGCNRGIGKAILEIFAHHGAKVWAHARKRSDDFSAFLEALRSQTGAQIEPVYFDLGDVAQIKEGIKTVGASKEPIHILVNSAGVIHTGPFMMTTEDKMRGQYDINFHAPMILMQYLSRGMARQKYGSIINLSSSAAIEGNEGRAAYAASKAALIAATKVLSRELGPTGVRVNAVAPGLTQTDMMENSTPEEALKTTVARVALRRVGNPDEIAKVVLFLASDLSSYITGQVLRVDGGM